MGNDPNKYISLHITEEDTNIVLDEKKKDEFYKLYQQFSMQNGFLTKDDFRILTKLEDDKILEQVFDIFSSKKGKMYFSELINFYTSFTNKRLKIILFSFLLFGKTGRIPKKNYINNLSEFMTINDTFIILSSENFLKSIISNEKGTFSYISSLTKNYIYGSKEKDTIYFDKNNFIKQADSLVKSNLLNFSFVKNIIQSSKLGKLKIKEMKVKIHSYVCDCLLENMNDNLNNTDELEEMRSYFNRDKAVKNGHLPFGEFEKIMKDLRVNQKLIDIILKFLKNYTMKDYLNFEDFKSLMSNIYFRVAFKNKKIFLFKMLLTIFNEKSSIKASQLGKILQIENKEYKSSGAIDENSFISSKDPIINSEIEAYIGYMDTFGLMPYLKFNVKPIGQELKKKIINFILNKRTAEEYLVENFDDNNVFFAINMPFWNSLVNPEEFPEIEVNNSIIGEEDDIYNIGQNKEKEEKNEKQDQQNENNQKSSQQEKEKQEKEKNIEIPKKKEKLIGKLKKDLKYGQDYVIICGDLYQKISEYFQFDYIIKFHKITKYLQTKEKNEGETPQEISDSEPHHQKEEKLEINKEKNYIYRKGNEKEGIKEYVVDFFPVKILQFSFSTLLNYEEREKKKLDDKKKEEIWEKKTNEEKESYQKRVNQYNQKLIQLKNLKNEGAIDKSLFDEKIKLLQEQYKDLFDKEEKGKEEITKLKKSEFFELLKSNIKDIIFSYRSKIQKQSRFSTVRELKDILIKFNKNLNNENFNILFYTSKNEYFIPKDETTFIDNEIEDFSLIIIDIKDDKGQSYLDILEKNENEIVEKENENEKDNINIKDVELKDTEILTKEELKKIKDNLNEKEKLKKQQEKIEREKYEKMEKEKLEKIKKEQEKEIRPPYGIPNFGNTCYFNAVNQIFFNLPIMQQLFMNQKLKYFINKNNKFGYGGKFILNFMLLYQLKPSKIDDYAQNLKILVGKFKNTFNNRDQQDANEYLNFVLEALHEELNLKSTKRYIIDKDENYKYNNEEELGNIAWANNLRRNVSFIDSIFMFQLKSNLTCKKCGTKKFNFETNYVFDLPLSLCKIVSVEINLYRLPFKYKIYYDKINKNFADFIKLEENKNKNILENLWNYYTIKLNYEQKLEHIVHVNFEFDFERQKSIGDILKLLRNISLLELEPEFFDVNINNQEISEYKIKNYTEFIVYSSDKLKVIKNDKIIDKYVDINDRIRLNVYEVLNTNGFNLIRKDKENKNIELNLFSYKIKKKRILKLTDYEKCIENSNYYNKDNNKVTTNEGDTKSSTSSPSEDDNVIEGNKKNIINIISFNDYLSYFQEEIFNNNIKELNSKKTKQKIISEYLIPIVHYKREIHQGRSTIFVDFYNSRLKEFPQQFLVFNNSNYYQITPKYLYNYIWDYNSLYMNHPNKKTDKFWYNFEINSDSFVKKCYPFVIRIVRKNKKFNSAYNCARCQWYNFCIGCILYPDDDNFLEIESDCVIFVEWCNSLIKEEIESFNFNTKKIPSEKITQCIESSAKNDKSNKYQSIKDCFDLFFEKELLEDPLSCRVCGGPQNFIKNYEINRLPYILILSLKRFKYNENNNFKLKQLITYPIYDFELKNKKYDLFGVIYHYGGINSGHYTCVIKYNNKWIMCDDRSVYEVNEERVMCSNAYILFYISKESINSNNYYNCLMSLVQHIVIDKNKKEFIFKDTNFFQGEPVITPYGEGYIEENYIEDFKIEENNNEANNEGESKGETIEKEDKNEIEGEIIDKINKNKNGIVKVKFDFGRGTINKENIEKQIL